MSSGDWETANSYTGKRGSLRYGVAELSKIYAIDSARLCQEARTGEAVSLAHFSLCSVTQSHLARSARANQRMLLSQDAILPRPS